MEPTEIILNFIFFVVLASILIMLIIYRIRLKNVFTYLIIAMFLAVISQSLYILFLFNIFIPIFDSELLNYFLIFTVLFFVYFHYDEISSIKPSKFRNYFMISYGMICTTLIFTASMNLFVNQDLIVKIIYLISSVYVLFIFLFPLSVMLKSHLILKERAPLIEFISLILIQLSNIVFLIGYLFMLTSETILYEIILFLIEFANYLLLGGLILIIINYLIHKNYVFRLPFPVHEVFMFNKSGILVHSQEVKTTHLSELDSTEHMLISGVMIAITELVKKILGEKSHLEFIDAGSHQIIFSEIPKVGGLVAMISSGHNKLLKKSLQRFTLSMSEDILNGISKFSTRNESLTSELNKLLLRAFPYLEII